MPLLLLPLLSVMSRMDPNLRDASAGLGASKWRTLLRVTLPLSLPGLVAGCMLVFASSTTAFISQFVIGGNRLVYLPLLIWQQSLVVYNWPLASVAALTLLVSVGLGVAAIAAVGRRRRAYAASHGQRAEAVAVVWTARRLASDTLYSIIIGLLAGVGFLILVGPVIIVLLTSFTEGRSIKFPPSGLSLQWYQLLFDPGRSQQIHRAAFNSLQVAAVAMVLATALATLASVRHCPPVREVGAGARHVLHVAA